MSNSQDPFVSIDAQELAGVSGGADRIASTGSDDTTDELMQMMQQITTSISTMQSNNSGMDPTTMMMMMMMMGGMGGGSTAAASPYGYGAAAAPTYVQVGVQGGCSGKCY